MIKLIAIVLHALLWDANRARRWLRGSIGVLAVSGAIYAQQVDALGHPKIATAIRDAALVCSFAVAAHDSKKKKGGKLIEVKP